MEPDDSTIKEPTDRDVAPKLTSKDEDSGSVQQRELLQALRAMRAGDFTIRLPVDLLGLSGKIAETFNDIVEANQRMAEQLEGVGQVVGREGKTRRRVNFGLSQGAWGEMETSVNTLIDDLLWPTTEVTRVISAVAQGDLLQTVQLEVDGRLLQGEFLRAATIVNAMIKQLANEEIQSFAYMVGHDLRGPLVNIMGFTSELQALRDAIFERLGEGGEAFAGERLDPKAAAAEFDEAIGFIKAATVKMERLINAILAISRAGKRELKPEKIDMSALVKGVVTTLAHEAQAVNAEIEVGTLPSITCDRLALEQVFSNLLDNAVKYLRRGEPGRIQVTGYASSERVIYEVRDNGRGIAEADQKRVFELFRRAGAQDQRGEGIGLASVRALVRRLGGTIKLTSALNSGSTFQVALPRNFTDQR